METILTKNVYFDIVFDMKHSFLAELKEIKLRKLVSLDHEIKLTFVTDDKKALELADYDPDTIFEVKVIKHEQTR